MQLINKLNKGFRFLLCVIDIFSKYDWFFLLKDKEDVTIVTVFQSILKKSNKKSGKLWRNKGTEFYNSFFKKWLQDNTIEMYSTHNEGRWGNKGTEFCNSFFKKWLQDNTIEMYSTHNERRSIVAERFIRTLKNRIYK